MEKVQYNLEKIKAEIAHYNPTIIAVTKYFDEEQIMKYYDLGIRDFGENRVKEALKKIEKLPKEIKETSKFHFIGHLQTNKVKLVVGIFDIIHSVDSVKLAEAINDAAQKKEIKQKILLQINNAREEQKTGFMPEEVRSAVKEILKMDSIRIEGVMNIAPINCDENRLHKLFKNIKQINDDLKYEFGLELKQISMGMSNDYKIALEEGATMIRLGRILFE